MGELERCIEEVGGYLRDLQKFAEGTGERPLPPISRAGWAVEISERVVALEAALRDRAS